MMATTTPQYLSKLSKVRKVCNLSKVQHHDRGKVCEFCFNLYILTDTSHTVPKSAPIPRDVIDTDGYLADIQVIDIEDQDTLEVLKKTPKESSRDVNHFFLPSHIINNKKLQTCRLCT